MQKPEPRVLAIRTDFLHHGENFGYKQILKFTKPAITLGINERDPAQSVSILKRKYLWLYEFEAYRNRRNIDLVHILYGEDYFRWSTGLFKNTPVVATFHQPAETLLREITSGDVRGRVGKWTHNFTRNRFKKLAAAIVTSASQKEVLKKVMPEEKIRIIPLGLHLKPLNEVFNKHRENTRNGNRKIEIITVGNWMRDWDFYYKIVEDCPEWSFHLINRNISDQQLARTMKLPNLKFHRDIKDSEMFELYSRAHCQFLPVKGIAGSNAFLQGLALGCPVILTDLNGQEPGTDKFVFLYKPDSINDCKNKIRSLAEKSESELGSIRMEANKFANLYSWENIAEETKKLYKELI